ncbi:MAG: nucleotidyltransferase [Candidatus Methanomarinus sp.]|uniref:Nucleotidyltransferase n=1 Tax=Candidatus Methanomarinus sp. TaxID=3386244 RepID=A0AC61SDA4_9EURY|nr:MAG: nucleotidyltransferase [ANME-2 cluster archaeon]
MVMAGGKGRRMKLSVEKPLIEINEIKMIEYVIRALSVSSKIDRIFVAISSNSPETENWLANIENNDHINITRVINTSGNTYISDMVEAVIDSNTKGPILIIMADLPMVTSMMINKIIDRYEKVPQSALSVYNLISSYFNYGLNPELVFNNYNQLIVPIGINIVNADIIDVEQDDYNYILEDHELVINVNTQQDLEVCINIMKKV